MKIVGQVIAIILSAVEGEKTGEKFLTPITGNLG